MGFHVVSGHDLGEAGDVEVDTSEVDERRWFSNFANENCQWSIIPNLSI